jgi:ATP-dependent Clp protease ATP-binding subunit ClpX
MDGIKFSISDDALDYIVDKAIEYKLGARGLRSIFETIMMDAMYSMPSKKIKKFELTREYAEQQLESSNFAVISTSL